MARNRVREQLLAEVKERRRAAGQKVSRLERQGVRVRKAELDPRLSNSQLEAMNARQLRSHLNRLNSFTSRSNGYVAGLKGEPISAQTWRQYRRLEKQYNKKTEAFYNSIKDLHDPVINKTIEQRLEDLRSSTRAGDYRSFNTLERNAANITGDESMKKLLKQMQKRVDPRYLEREARLQRRIINKMLARTGNKDLIEKFKEASDEDIITLAQYTDFMPTLEGSYAMSKSISADTPRWQSSVFEDNEDKLQEWAEWAHRHFSDSEQDSDDSRPAKTAKPGRDRFGRFTRGTESKPDPTFARDEHGRFAKRT